MSMLDRAFLKAHSKTAPAGSAPARPHLPPRPQTLPAATTAEALARLREASQKGVQVSVHAASPPPAVPAPHIAPAEASHPPARLAMPATVPNMHPAQAATGPAALRAVFEIQKLSWPVLCQALVRAAEAELAVLADELAAAARRGDNLVLVTGARRGEGRTTVLVCLARMLSTRGLQVGLVDGDFAQPGLARRLKLLPQTGWESPLAGDLPLEEALIEAVDDKTLVLPLRGPLEPRQVAEGRAGIRASLQRMAATVDIVLVDGGPLESAPTATRHLIQASPFDVAIVVRDARSAPADEAAAVSGRLAAAGIARSEIVENFFAP
jgi:Mrp family chromosome partitioning ATPase